MDLHWLLERHRFATLVSVASRYIANPLLVGGKKFHIRAYVLCIGNLTAYVYNEALALFARKAYPVGHSDLTNLSAHLTNTCAQKRKSAYQQSSTDSDDESGDSRRNSDESVSSAHQEDSLEDSFISATADDCPARAGSASHDSRHALQHDAALCATSAAGKSHAHPGTDVKLGCMNDKQKICANMHRVPSLTQQQCHCKMHMRRQIEHANVCIRGKPCLCLCMYVCA